MAKKVRDLLEDITAKNSNIYIPSGKVEWRLPTDILSLDRILGGGIPGGTIMQIFGNESVGKTSISLHIAASAVSRGIPTVLIPLETYYESHARTIGVDVDNKDLFQVWASEYANDTFSTLDYLIRESDAKLFIIDSISAAAEKEVKEDINDKNKNPMGLKARKISMFLDNIQQPIRRKGIILLIINQLRTDLSGFRAFEIPTGGKALQYYTDLKINLSKKQEKGYIKTTATLKKGKVEGVFPFATTEFNIYYGTGVDKSYDLVLSCSNVGIIEKAGAWFKYSDNKWQGFDAAAKAISENKELRDELYNKYMGMSVELNTEEGEDTAVE